MDKKHLVIVLLAVASAFGLASCKSSAGPLSGKGGELMPAADYLAMLDGIDSAICVSLDYNRHRYARGTAFFLSWRWGCAVGDRSARDSLDAVAMRGTDSWTRSRSGSDDLAALRSGRIVVDTAYVSRGGGKARPVELRSCRFRVLSNPPARYELSGSFLYKGKAYTFTMRENQRHNVCDVSGE